MKVGWGGIVGRIPTLLYWLPRQLVPIACVDVLPLEIGEGEPRVGLIRRETGGGTTVWAMVGGGVHRGETIDEAIHRHVRTTLGARVKWQYVDGESDPVVAEYFPWERQGHGIDSRKHAIALSYAVRLGGHPSAQDEAIEFKWFKAGSVPSAASIWAGQHAPIMRLLEAQGGARG